MGRTLHYRPGSFYRVDDRTGFPQRAERTKKQWNGIIVDETVWEPRQPQDLVKGVKDQQNVPEPRPLAPNFFVGPIYVQITGNVGVGGHIIPLASTAGLSLGDAIGVMLDPDKGVLFQTGIAAITATGIITFDAMPGPVSSGNEIVDYRFQYTASSRLPYLLDAHANPIASASGGLLLGVL